MITCIDVINNRVIVRTSMFSCYTHNFEVTVPKTFCCHRFSCTELAIPTTYVRVWQNSRKYWLFSKEGKELLHLKRVPLVWKNLISAV